MILDQLTNHPRIARNGTVTRAFEFLQQQSAQSEDKRYFLDEERVFVIVKTCSTAVAAPATLEAHRRYLDVHFNIQGDEAFEWCPLNGLEPKGEYLTGPDAMLYVRPNPAPWRFVLPRGHFVAFFPNDAHGAQLATGSNSTQLKKAVLKISLELIYPDLAMAGTTDQRT